MNYYFNLCGLMEIYKDLKAILGDSPRCDRNYNYKPVIKYKTQYIKPIKIRVRNMLRD